MSGPLSMSIAGIAVVAYAPRLRNGVLVAIAVATPAVKAPICSWRYMRKTWLFQWPSFCIVVASYFWR